jgi:hypothetical protein
MIFMPRFSASSQSVNDFQEPLSLADEHPQTYRGGILSNTRRSVESDPSHRVHTAALLNE